MILGSPTIGRHQNIVNEPYENAYGMWGLKLSQPAFVCSKLTIETLKQGVKYVEN